MRQTIHEQLQKAGYWVSFALLCLILGAYTAYVFNSAEPRSHRAVATSQSGFSADEKIDTAESAHE